MHLKHIEAETQNMAIMDVPTTRGRAIVSAQIISAVFLLVILLTGCQQHRVTDASSFLGPPIGETIHLERKSDGAVKKRICTSISKSGTYSIEERTRFLNGSTNQKGLPERLMRILRGEEDLVENYTLEAKGDKLIITRSGEPSFTIIDFKNRKWVQNGTMYPSGNFKEEYRIVKEDIANILGEMRKVVYVETHSRYGKNAYTIASGLGMIRSEIHNENSVSVDFTLKE